MTSKAKNTNEERDVVVRMNCTVELGADPIKNANAVNDALAKGFTILGMDGQRVNLICDSVAPALAGRCADVDLPASRGRPANLIQVGSKSNDERKEKKRAYMREYFRRKRAAAAKPGQTPAAPAKPKPEIAARPETKALMCELCKKKLWMTKCPECSKKICAHCQQGDVCRECASR